MKTLIHHHLKVPLLVVLVAVLAIPALADNVPIPKEQPAPAQYITNSANALIPMPMTQEAVVVEVNPISPENWTTAPSFKLTGLSNNWTQERTSGSARGAAVPMFPVSHAAMTDVVQANEGSVNDSAGMNWLATSKATSFDKESGVFTQTTAIERSVGNDLTNAIVRNNSGFSFGNTMPVIILTTDDLIDSARQSYNSFTDDYADLAFKQKRTPLQNAAKTKSF